MPAKPSSPGPDRDTDELDSTFYPVDSITLIAQNVIRKSHSPAGRQRMWDAYLAAVSKEAQAPADTMPWESPGNLTVLSARQARDILTSMLRAVPDSVEQARLAKITAAECEKLENGESGVPVSAVRCQVCSKPLNQGSKASRRTCGDNCRQKLRQRRLRASRQAPAVVKP